MSKNTDIARVLLILRVEKRVCQKMKCANLGCAKKNRVCQNSEIKNQK